MTERVHGKVKKGVWVEQEVTVVVMEFDDSLDQIGPGNAFTSDYENANSILSHAVKLMAGNATVLGVFGPWAVTPDSASTYAVMLGYAAGHSSPANNGVIMSGVNIAGVDSGGNPVSANMTATFGKLEEFPLVTAADMAQGPDGNWRPTEIYT